MTVATVHLCDGCEGEISAYEALQWSVCMPCTKARHKAVLKRKCCCGRKKRERSEPHRIGSRVWFTCNRCLGTTRQIS